MISTELAGRNAGEMTKRKYPHLTEQQVTIFGQEELLLRKRLGVLPIFPESVFLTSYMDGFFHPSPYSSPDGLTQYVELHK